MIHEQNAVMGRANRMLAPRVRAIATGFPGVLDRDPALAAKATLTGNPVRPAVIAAAATAYPPPDAGGPLQLLVFGGSQGARVMADIVPAAIERLEPRVAHAATVVQQAREEDLPRVRETYAQASGRGRGGAVFRRPAGAHGGEPSRRVALGRLYRRRACGDRPARASWCRCRMRSTRTSSPTPAC